MYVIFRFHSGSLIDLLFRQVSYLFHPSTKPLSTSTRMASAAGRKEPPGFPRSGCWQTSPSKSTQKNKSHPCLFNKLRVENRPNGSGSL